MPRGRKPGDGRGRLGGGRAKGQISKHVSLRNTLARHSEEYFQQNIELKDEEGNPTGKMISQYEIDIMQLKPSDRVRAEIDILKFHTPTMQATSVDLTTSEANTTLSERLTKLSTGEEIASPTE